MYNVVTICNASIILSSVIRFSIDMVHDYGNSSRKKDCSKIKWSRELLLIFLTISICNNIVQYIVQANKYSLQQKKGAIYAKSRTFSPFILPPIYHFPAKWQLFSPCISFQHANSNSLDHFILEQSFFLDEFP